MVRARSRDLRKGRVSIAGQPYAVSGRIQNVACPILADPKHPLKSSRNAHVIEDALRWLHKASRLQCHAYTVMPDHIHLVFVLGESDTLSEVMRSFFRFTARRINEANGWSGRFWQNGFYDHAIRSERAYERHLRYVLENPVRRGYVLDPRAWPFSEIWPDW